MGLPPGVRQIVKTRVTHLQNSGKWGRKDIDRAELAVSWCDGRGVERRWKAEAKKGARRGCGGIGALGFQEEAELYPVSLSN